MSEEEENNGSDNSPVLPPAAPGVNCASPASASAVVELPPGTGAVSAKEFYNKHDCSLCALLVLYYGLMHDDDTPVIDLSRGPWSKMKISAFCVVAKDYQAEITCRWEVMCTKKPELKSHAPPHPSQWTIAKIQLWLLDNPVSDDNDCAFILSAVDERIDAAARADVERNNTAVSELFNKNWVGKEPIL
jgi:hypothetical protein